MTKSIDFEDEFSYDSGSSDSDKSRGEVLDIQQYLRILRKHKWPIMLFSALVTVCAGYYAYTATPIYSATSTLLIESQQQANVLSIEELIGSDTESSDYYQTQFELLKSRRLAERVIDYLNLWDDPLMSSVAAARLAADQSVNGGDNEGGINGLISDIKARFSSPVNSAAEPQASVSSTSMELPREDATVSGAALLGEERTTTRVALAKGREARAKLSDQEQANVVSRYMRSLNIAPGSWYEAG